MKKNKSVLVSLMFLLASGLAWGWLTVTDRRVWITYCDVGQGDGIVIRRGNFQAVVDGGPDNGRMVDCVADQLPPWDRQIELMVVTHPDADHLGGLVSLLDQYKVFRVVDNGQPAETQIGRLFQEKTASERQTVSQGDLIRLSEIELEILWPPLPAGEGAVLGGSATAGEPERNDESLVLSFRFGQFDLLLTGDAGESVEKRLWLAPVEVLKVSHHGSKTATSAKLLEMIKPQLAVISVGKNWYGHPDKDVLERLVTGGAEIIRTDQVGTVRLVTDGQKWSLVGG